VSADEGHSLFASHAPGPTPAEAAAPIVARISALERKAATAEATAERARLAAEAQRLRQRLTAPGEYSRKSRDEQLRLRHVLGDGDA
jgi:hypothetical protein